MFNLFTALDGVLLEEGYVVFVSCKSRAQNNGRSTGNVRPDRGLDRSNSRLAGHFDRSFLDACRLMRFAL